MAEYKPDKQGNMKFKGNDYQMVFGRIKEAHEKIGGTFCMTTVIVNDIEQAMNEQVLMKTTLIVDGDRAHPFTGYAHEKKLSSGKDVNSTCHIENCETSARGRALLAAGFGTGSASAEEMMKVDRYEKADAANKQQKPNTAKPAQEPKAEAEPTPEQPTYRQMCVDVMATEAFKDICMQQYGSMQGMHAKLPKRYGLAEGEKLSELMWYDLLMCIEVMGENTLEHRSNLHQFLDRQYTAA